MVAARNQARCLQHLRLRQRQSADAIGLRHQYKASSQQQCARDPSYGFQRHNLAKPRAQDDCESRWLRQSKRAMLNAFRHPKYRLYGKTKRLKPVQYDDSGGIGPL
jgi:hypothetical protein